MVGGASKMCHIITTAMFLSSSAAITYLTYHNALPILTRAMPKLCDGAYDQALGHVTSLWNSSSSCAARQAAWDRLREKVLAGTIGAQGMLIVLDKVLLGKSKFKEMYNKVLTWNEANLCPLFSSFSLAATSKVKNAACIMLTAPFKALFAVGRGVAQTLKGMENPLAELYGQSFSSDASSRSSSRKTRSRSRSEKAVGTSMMEELAQPVELESRKEDIRQFFKPSSLHSKSKSPNPLAKMRSKSR
jgi:hypothetical protein